MSNTQGDEETLPRGRLVEYEVREWRDMKPSLKDIIRQAEFRNELKKWMRSYTAIVIAGVSVLWGLKGEIPWILQKLLEFFQ